MEKPLTRGFVVHCGDNVATVLGKAKAGSYVRVFGARNVQEVIVRQAQTLGHKIAIVPIEAGEAVVKYGVQIGEAIQPIGIGEWVHLHNCRSNMDVRSGEFDTLTGEGAELRYE